jgi:hypothetical protein
MHPRQSLVVLGDQARRRIRRLRARASYAFSGAMAHPAQREELVGWVVIEALNCWSNFVRSYLISLLFRAMRRSGARVSIGNAAITSPGALIHVAAKAQRGPSAAAPTNRRDEPSWHDVPLFLKVCVALNPSNLSSIQSALSLQVRALYDLPTFRNFYAHRNEESAAKAVSLARTYYLISGERHPTAVLGRFAPMRPQQLLLDWLDDLDSIVDLLCD